MIELSVPGKLFIAGEYAVVEPGHPAIIVAVDQFITVMWKRPVKTAASSLPNTATCRFAGRVAKAN
jgi:mevalonate kinase